MITHPSRPARTRHRSFGAAVYLLVVIALFAGSEARGELSPENVAVVANKNVPAGVELAKYYMEKRGIAQSHLYVLDLPTDEGISRAKYDDALVAPLRTQIEKRGDAKSIRVLVTMFGVPLRVDAPELSDDDRQVLSEAVSGRAQAMQALTEVAKQGADLARKLGGKPPSDLSDLDGEIGDDVRITRVHERIRIAAEALQKVDPTSEDAKHGKETLNRIINSFGGLAAISQAVKVAPGKQNQQAEEMIQRIRKDVDQARQLIAYLDETRTLVNRRRAMAITGRIFGASGVLLRTNLLGRWLSSDKADASVDSELSFLWWDHGTYLLSGNVPNPFFHSFQNQPGSQFNLPLMMVSRLDGPKVELVRGMIDRAIAAERDGLQGKVYVDARGIDAPKGYGVYDQNLRDFAWVVREETELSTELENTDRRWSEPGEAPDVALYAGWYRLRHYEPAFTFRPGAIGVHFASEEAMSLRDPDEQGWCKRAIEEGITATFGAVSEPYIETFPLPLEFFGVLMTGKVSLVDAYYLTIPVLSWKMVLLGDPLYTPFRKHGVLAPGVIAKKSEHAKTLNPLPALPSTREFADPVAARAALAKRRKDLDGEIEKFFKAAEDRAKARGKEQEKEQGKGSASSSSPGARQRDEEK